ncbi:unnamed protein product [Musa acuminata var. zebrina]
MKWKWYYLLQAHSYRESTSMFMKTLRTHQFMKTSSLDEVLNQYGLVIFSAVILPIFIFSLPCLLPNLRARPQGKLSSRFQPCHPLPRPARCQVLLAVLHRPRPLPCLLPLAFPILLHHRCRRRRFHRKVKVGPRRPKGHPPRKKQRVT